MANVYKSGEFPTEYRYIEWIITTPLMLIKLPMLLGLGGQGKKWLTQLVVLDLIMIVTAYIAEVSPIASGTWWTFFLVAVVAWAAIIRLLFTGIGEQSVAQPSLSRRSPADAALHCRRLDHLFGCSSLRSQAMMEEVSEKLHTISLM